MRRNPKIRVLSATISLGLILGCRGVTEPIGNGTTFVLESVNGARLPAASGSSSTATTLIADTLIFLGREDRNSGQFQHRETSVSGPYTPQFSYWGWYIWQDGPLSISWPSCPFGAFCSSYTPTPATGRFGPGTLTITYGKSGLYPRTYRRVN